MSAPLITKQLKHNSFTDIQAQLLNRKVETVSAVTTTNANNISAIVGTKNIETYAQYIQSLENRISALDNNPAIQNILKEDVKIKDYDKDIAELQNSLKTNSSSVSKLSDSLSALKDDLSDMEEDIKKVIPSGSILIFNTSTGTTGCPTGWTNISESFSGRYLMLDKTANVGNDNKSYLGNHRHLLGYVLATGNDPNIFYTSNKFGSGKSITDDYFAFIAYNEARYTGQTAGVGYSHMFITAQEVLNKNSSISNEIEVKPASLSVIACKKN